MAHTLSTPQLAQLLTELADDLEQPEWVIPLVQLRLRNVAARLTGQPTTAELFRRRN